ncbi:MAG: aspartate kinase [Parachlamydiaceae bacterium]|nr:aspartate kinase [Parachlamydiaceae bacterium]
MNDTLVMKFGGAAVSSIEQFAKIADIIISRQKHYSRLIIVVSAMGETTNQLIDLAKKVHPKPPQREYDMLISVGERISMTLLAMALCNKNVEAISFTGSQSGIITCNNHTNAGIIEVRPFRIANCLEEGKIVIVAGFQGISTNKEITTLGRGGSDTTAVALGLALGASKVEFFKDVPGVFDEDPKKCQSAIQYSEMTYQKALEIVSRGARILHHRAIQLAEKNGLPLHVRSFIPSNHSNEGTLIIDPTITRGTVPQYEEG